MVRFHISNNRCILRYRPLNTSISEFCKRVTSTRSRTTLVTQVATLVIVISSRNSLTRTPHYVTHELRQSGTIRVGVNFMQFYTIFFLSCISMMHYCHTLHICREVAGECHSNTCPWPRRSYSNLPTTFNPLLQIRSMLSYARG